MSEERIFQATVAPGELETILRSAKERKDIHRLTAYETIKARMMVSTSNSSHQALMNLALVQISYRFGILGHTDVDRCFDMLISAAAKEGI